MKTNILLMVIVYILNAGIIELQPIIVETNYGNNNITQKEMVYNEIIIQETTPGFRNPIIQGLQGDKLGIVLNGIKYDNALFRGGPNQYYSWIPQEFIQSIVLDDSLMKRSSAATIGATIGLTAGIDKNEVGITFDSKNNGYSEYLKYKNLDVQIGLSTTKTSNLVTPNGEIEHTSYNQNGVLLAFPKKMNTILIYSESDDIDRTDKFEKGDYYVYDIQRYLKISQEYNFDNGLEIISSIQHSREVVDRQSSKSVSSLDNNYGMNITHIYNLNDTSYISTGLSNNFECIIVNDSSYNYNTMNVWIKYGVDHSYGTTDIRYMYSRMDIGKDIKKHLYNHSIYLHNTIDCVIPVDLFYFDFGTSFKFPTITNLAEAKDDSLDEIANPDLTQEKSINVEIGVVSDILEVKIYYKFLEDWIIRKQTNILNGENDFKYKYENSDSGRLYGINLTIDYKVESDIGVFVVGEYTNGRTEYGYISKLTPFHSKVKPYYKDIYVEWLYAPSVSESKMSVNDKTDTRIKNHNYGYSIFNLGYSKVIKKHKFRIVLDNVFDSIGRVYGSSTDFGERSISIDYSYRF